jgi:hypothetical protein
MGIYQPKVITESMVNKFRPTRLAIKELAGVKYFCKSIVEDIHSYPGSGVIWRDRIKKYGKENINTLWVSEWYYDPHQLQKDALKFSEDNQIVESSLWANCKPEDGLDGGRQTPEILARIASKTTGQKRTPEQNEAKSKRQAGSKKSQSWIDNRPGYDKVEYQWQNVKTGEIVTMNRRDFAKLYFLPKTKVYNQAAYALIKGNRPTMFGWKILQTVAKENK